MRIYQAGLRPCPGPPGYLLADMLRRTGGSYETTTPLMPQVRDDVREAAELTSDAELLAIAELTEVPVSSSNCAASTRRRIIIRAELRYEGAEAAQLSQAIGGASSSRFSAASTSWLQLPMRAWPHAYRSRKPRPAGRSAHRQRL